MADVEQRSDDPRIGTLLSQQFRVDGLLGQGGMGAVYSGTQLSVNRPVAIKLIGGAVARNQESVRRFRREAEAMAKLRHPNTVRLFEFGVTEHDELFMVMELLEGGDLGEHIAQHGALPPTAALTIARQVLESLCEAHALGVVHRDLKPANVYLAKLGSGQVLAKVTDFGIAGIEQAPGATRLTLTGAVMGTPAYMSPEQASGRDVDARSDLYSLGVTLFEMLVGRAPFEATTPASLLLAHVSKPPPKLADLRPELASQPELQRLLDRLLEKEPERRPATAEAALELVDALLRERPPSSLKLLGAPPIAGPAAVARTPRWTPLTAAGGRRTWLLAGVPVIVIVIALASWGLWPAAKPSHVVSPASQPLAAAPAAPIAAEPALRSVHIVSAPEHASVSLQGVELGKTPYDLQYRRDTEVALNAPGYQTYLLQVSQATEPNVAVELVKIGGPQTMPAERARPVPRQEERSPSVVAPAPAPRTPDARNLPSRERRQALLANGPPYRTVDAAKRAFRERRIDEAYYDDILWALKARRNQRIATEKLNYRQHGITREEYARRVKRIDEEYQGN